jgi:hypothetical protein
MHEQALPLIEKALAISSQTPDAGYPYTLQAIRIAALIGVKRYEEARHIANEVLTRSRENQRTAHEANALVLTAIIALDRRRRSMETETHVRDGDEGH